MTFNLMSFLSPASGNIWNTTFTIHIFAAFAGAFLFPFFMPVSVFSPVQGTKKKPLLLALGITILIFGVNLFIRFRGAEFWIGSRAAQLTMIISSGFFYCMCYGLFFQTHKTGDAKTHNIFNSAFLLALAIMSAVIIRRLSLSLFDWLTLEGEAAFLWSFSLVKWITLAAALSVIWTLLLLSGKFQQEFGSTPDINYDAINQKEDKKTDYALIIYLIILYLIFAVINSLIELRLFHEVSLTANSLSYPLYLVMPAVLILTFFIKRKKVLRIFFISCMVLFIMLPCLSLVKSPLLVFIMGTLTGIIRFSMWAVFSAIIIEHYHGKKLFYFFAVIIHLIHCISLFGFNFSNLFTLTVESSVILSALAAVLFTLISLRLLSHNLFLNEKIENPSLSAIFKEFKLSARETEIAGLIVEKGMINKNIAEVLPLARGTVDTYISNIYTKFNVNNRTEFMAFFVAKGIVSQTP